MGKVRLKGAPLRLLQSWLPSGLRTHHKKYRTIFSGSKKVKAATESPFSGRHLFQRTSLPPANATIKFLPPVLYIGSHTYWKSYSGSKTYSYGLKCFTSRWFLPQFAFRKGKRVKIVMNREHPKMEAPSSVMQCLRSSRNSSYESTYAFSVTSLNELARQRS